MRVEAIVKLGGSVITAKDKPMIVNNRALNRLASEISASELEKIVIVHGGGSFGHPLALKYKLNEKFTGSEEQIAGFTITHRAMLKLNERVLEALGRKGLKVAPLPPLAFATLASGSLKSMFYEPFINALNMNLTPVTFGDIVFDSDRGFSIVSGDLLMSELSRKLQPLKAIFTIDVDGLYVDDPKYNPDVELITEATVAEVEPLLSRLRFKSSDATGGIRFKLEQACRIACAGIDVYIVNGLKPGRLFKALKGEKVRGTLIKGVR
ncbi:isopentenyl phosphate kinase family protein [Candidatus Bathyarchaeota archaeon]|nr:isopentenyl phosphate kinase family protein [Candidatus Bathyarchaeota archaeon]MBS7617542.1 isopentenyl phosphate kinase family protein [Candidatus Bathyarchaeota archaeon]